MADDDDEGFDTRILAILALPLLGVSWAFFNVFHVAFRQVGRFNEGLQGGSKQGLGADD